MLHQPGLVLMPCCFDALSAKLIERAGFALTFMSGFAVSASRLGLPDTGLISFGEEEIGYKIAAYPLTLFNAAVCAMQKALVAVKHGNQAAGLLEFSVLQEIVGFNDYYEEEKRYGHDKDPLADPPR